MMSTPDPLDCDHLDDDEIDVIAEHEHVPRMVALEIGYTMARTEEGVRMFRRHLYDSTERALRSGQTAKADRLVRLFDSPRWRLRPLEDAVPQPPDAVQGSRPAGDATSAA